MLECILTDLIVSGGIVTIAAGLELVRNPGSVGTLVPSLEGRLVGEDGQDVPEDSAGELWLRGPSIAK